MNNDSKLTNINVNLKNPKLAKGSFLEENINIMPFIDPDSTRYSEWLWSVFIDRAPKETGKNLFMDYFKVPDNFPEVTVFSLSEELKALCPDGSYTSPNYFRGFRVSACGQYPELYVTATIYESSVNIHALGQKDEVLDIINKYRKLYRVPASITIANLHSVNPDGSFNIHNHTLVEENQNLAKDQFYPNVKEFNKGMDAYIQEFLKSSENVLVLWGEPGTGKSTFLRHLLFRCGRENLGVSNNSQAIMSPSIINWFNSLGDESVIALEDADLMVQARDKGNAQMSSILNHVEGVIKTRSKLVISTNLTNLKDIDSALIRKGRCFGVVHFSKISGQQANEARASIGLDPVDFGTNNNLSLAEALTWISDDDSKQHKRHKFGFVSL